MKKSSIFIIILAMIILASVCIYKFFNRVPESDIPEDNSLYSFTFTRFSWNGMVENDRGNKHYIYFTNEKVVIEKYGYDFDVEVKKETPITEEEFHHLEQEIAKWAEKYSFKDLAMAELRSDKPHPDPYLLDEHRLFVVDILYSNFTELQLSIRPENYKEMVSDLDKIFEEYN